MQTKRKIISIATSAVVSTLLVAAVVYATSTIGDDITVGDDLTVTDALAVTGATTLTGALTANGSVTLGDAIADTTIINGRVSTTSVAGSVINVGASYTYGEGMEIRYGVDDWTLGNSFKAAYFRGETSLGNASGGLRGMEIYGVSNITSGTTGLSNLQALYTEMLVKSGSGARTITNASSIEANISIDNQAATLTFTNNIYALKAKVQTGTGLADYTKVGGIAVLGRDNGTSRTFGNAISIEDPEATVAAWTKGLNISATNVVTPIYVSTDAGTIASEAHGIDLTYTGTLASGKGIVGGNFAVTTAGTAGSWASGIYAKVTQGTTKNVNGYISGAEFEVINTNTNVSDWFPLVLNANSTTLGSHSSYIALRNYGTAALNSFLWIEDQTIGTDSSTSLVSTSGSDLATTHTLRIIIDDTPYWILLNNAH